MPVFYELQAVAERIGGIESPALWQRVVPDHLALCRCEPGCHFVEVLDEERGMRLFLRAEIRFHTKVEDYSAGSEPCATALLQRMRLLLLGHVEQPDEK